MIVTASTAQANAALAKTQAQLNTTATAANRSAASTAKSTSKMSAAMATAAKYGALALGAALVVSAKRAAEFEDEMIKIHTQAGASRAEVDRMSKSVLEYARTQSEANPIELAKGLFRVESAGFRGARAMEVLAAAERLADVGAADLEDTTTALTGAMRSGVKGAGNVEKAIGTLNAIVGAGNMRMTDLVGAMGTGFLSNAKQMGVSLKQAGAALATLTVQGQPATQAATRLSMAFRMMMSPTDQAEAALKSLHLSVGQLGQMMQAGNFPGAIALLAQRLDALGTSPAALQQKAAIIREMFGARSSAGINAILQGLDDYNARLKQVGQESSKFHEKEIADNETLASQWNRLKATMDAWAISVGQAVDGPLRDLLKFMNGLTGVISAVVGWLAKFDFSLVEAAQAAGRLANKLFGVFGKLPGFIKGAMAGIGGFLISPFRNAAQAITGAIGKIRDVVGGLGGAVRKVTGGIASAFGTLYQAIRNIVTAIVDQVNELMGALKGPKIEVGGIDLSKGLIPQILGGQKGLMVPGRGSGDKVAALLEPGEVVLNRSAVAAMGGAKNANRINEMLPRFAKGGAVGFGSNILVPATALMLGAAKAYVKKHRGPTLGGGKAGWGVIGDFASQLGLTMTSGYRPGDTDSWHGVGRARDYGGPAGAMLQFAKALANRYGNKLLELIHTPLGFSIDNGRRTAPFAQAAHYDHVHVALQKGGIVGAFARAGADTGASKKAMYALFMAGLAESGMRDLPGGHSTSQGVLQLLASTASRMGINPHDEYAVAKAFLTRGYWGKGGAIGLAKAGHSAATIAHLVQGNATGTGVYSAQASAAQKLLEQSGLRFPDDVADLGAAKTKAKGSSVPMKLLLRLHRELIGPATSAAGAGVAAAKRAIKAAKRTSTVTDDIEAVQALQAAIGAKAGLVKALEAWHTAKRTGKGKRKALEALIGVERGLIPVPPEAEAAETADNSEMIALLQEQANKLAQQLYVSEKSYQVLAQTPYIGAFGRGGTVPGPMGAPRLATVHGGETISPAGAAPVIVVQVLDGAVNANRIRAISGRQAEKMARRAGRGRIPGQPGSMV